MKLATQLSFNSFVQVWSILPSWSRKLINFSNWNINERTRYVTDNRLIKSLEIVWAVDTFSTFLIKFHTFPLPFCANKLERELDNHRSITVEKQANGAWRKQLDSSATSWSCNFQLIQETWIQLFRHFLDQLLFIEHLIFNFLIKSLDQESWSRKLLVWQGL